MREVKEENKMSNFKEFCIVLVFLGILASPAHGQGLGNTDKNSWMELCVWVTFANGDLDPFPI